jgi:hypothetical protein
MEILIMARISGDIQELMFSAHSREEEWYLDRLIGSQSNPVQTLSLLFTYQ